MNIAQLDCFISLAKTLNFTKSAQAMFVTQPAFSRRISALEEELGTQLVNRQSQKLQLTSEGKAFLPYCMQIRELYKEGRNKALSIGRETNDNLKIGLLRDAREDVFTAAALDFRKIYPQVTLEILDFPHSKVEEALLERTIDIGFFNSQNLGKFENIDYVVTGVSPQCIVMPKNHRLAGKKSVHAQELKGEHFILLSREFSPYFDILCDICKNGAGFIPNDPAWCDVITALLNHVRCGDGISFLSDKTALLASDDLCYIPLESAPDINHLAVWKKDNKNPRIFDFVEILKEKI